jgi:cytochrome c biogenesis protein CcdA
VNPSLNILTAFLAGVVSFVSPCVLPLIPAYLSFLTGSSLEELKAHSDASERARVLLHALAFIAGFTLVFMALGFTASAIGTALIAYRDWIAKLGGLVVIVLGLNMIGVASRSRPAGRRASARSSPVSSRLRRRNNTVRRRCCCSCTRWDSRFRSSSPRRRSRARSAR